MTHDLDHAIETRGIALSPEKTLGEQCPPNPKLILKKKKKKLGLRNKGRRKGGMYARGFRGWKG